MVWSLALCPDNAKQDPVVYVVFLAKDSRTASIQEGLDCLGFYHSGLGGERQFRLVVELTCVPPDALKGRSELTHLNLLLLGIHPIRGTGIHPIRGDLKHDA